MSFLLSSLSRWLVIFRFIFLWFEVFSVNKTFLFFHYSGSYDSSSRFVVHGRDLICDLQLGGARQVLFLHSFQSFLQFYNNFLYLRFFFNHFLLNYISLVGFYSDFHHAVQIYHIKFNSGAEIEILTLHLSLSISFSLYLSIIYLFFMLFFYLCYLISSTGVLCQFIYLFSPLSLSIYSSIFFVRSLVYIALFWSHSELNSWYFLYIFYFWNINLFYFTLTNPWTPSFAFYILCVSHHMSNQLLDQTAGPDDVTRATAPVRPFMQPDWRRLSCVRLLYLFVFCYCILLLKLIYNV